MRSRLRAAIGRGPSDDMAREVAWMARCIGRGDWAPLHEVQLSELSARLSTQERAPGEPIFQQGDAASAVWILREGKVEVSFRHGGSKLLIQIMHPGDVEGDIPLILGMGMPYSARAIDGVRLLRLSADDFEHLISTHPALARRWLSSVAARLHHAERRILQLGTHDLRAQLARLLLDEQWEGRIELPQATLAALLAVRRPSLNKVVKEFEQRGLVRVSYRLIEIADAEALRAIAAPTYPIVSAG